MEVKKMMDAQAAIYTSPNNNLAQKWSFRLLLRSTDNLLQQFKAHLRRDHGIYDKCVALQICYPDWHVSNEHVEQI